MAGACHVDRRAPVYEHSIELRLAPPQPALAAPQDPTSRGIAAPRRDDRHQDASCRDLRELRPRRRLQRGVISRPAVPVPRIAPDQPAPSSPAGMLRRLSLELDDVREAIRLGTA